MSSDGSGVLKVQSGGVTTNALAWGSYAYVSSSVPTIKSSYNISSITRNSAGNYTLAFTNATSDANYSVSSVGTQGTLTANAILAYAATRTTSNFVMITGYVKDTSGDLQNFDYGFDFAVFGN